jgi:hypothetical protein
MRLQSLTPLMLFHRKIAEQDWGELSTKDYC